MSKHWTREESKERFPRPITPLGWSLLQVPLEATLTQMSKTLGVKTYHSSEMLLWKDNYIYSRKDFFTKLTNLKFQDGHLIKILFALAASFFGAVFGYFSEEGNFKDRFFLRAFYRIFSDQTTKMIQNWPEEIAHLKKIMGRDFHLENVTTIDFERFSSIRIQMQEDSRKFFAEDFNVYFMKKLVFELLKSELISAGTKSLEAEEMISTLSNDLEGNFSIRMIEDFNNSSLSTSELKRRYGHLTDNWDLYAPTFGEQEAIWTKREIVHSGSKKESLNQKEEIKRRLSWNKKCDELIHWFEQLVLMDEDLRAYSSLQYPQARKLMELVEQTPAWKELIVRDDSIYFLSLLEIEHGLKKQDFHAFFDFINPRREAFLAAQKIHPPFELLQSETGTFTTPVPKKVGEQKTRTMKGVAVSHGTVTGKVVFINDSSDLSKVTKETILVLESATPVYAPFYTLSGGIISEMGGRLSHGAIVAREYGIPMLTGVENACVILKEGQSITLDADQGIVKVD